MSPPMRCAAYDRAVRLGTRGTGCASFGGARASIPTGSLLSGLSPRVLLSLNGGDPIVELRLSAPRFPELAVSTQVFEDGFSTTGSQKVTRQSEVRAERCFPWLDGSNTRSPAEVSLCSGDVALTQIDDSEDDVGCVDIRVRWVATVHAQTRLDVLQLQALAGETPRSFQRPGLQR